MPTITIRNMRDRLVRLMKEEPESADRPIFIQTKKGSLTNLEPAMETEVSVGRTKLGYFIQVDEDNAKTLYDVQTVAVIGVNWVLKTVNPVRSVVDKNKG